MTCAITRLAREFMMEPGDLADIFLAYFTETAQILQDCEAALTSGDLQGLIRLGHSIKGSSSNLRLEKAQRYALELEAAAREGDRSAASRALQALVCEIDQAEEEVSNYYREAKTT